MSSSNSLQRNDDLLKQRMERLQALLPLEEGTAFLIEHPVDLYYLTGEMLSVGQLWISANRAGLFVDSRYLEKAKKLSFLSVDLTSWEAFRNFIVEARVQKVFFDASKTSFERAQALQENLGKTLSWVSKSSITESLRKIKDHQELASIKKSAEILWEGYLFMKTLFQEGISERQVAKRFEIFCLEIGAEGLSFKSNIGFGENSALPHHRAGERMLKKGDIVLIDIGVFFNGYASDMTRTLFFGPPDPFFVRWRDLVIEAQQEALSLCRPGEDPRRLDAAARSVFQREGVEPYFVHSLGHGIGLEVHEPPRLKFDHEADQLEPGMVITVEPGLYLPGKGGVRYEDMVIITESGFENLFPLDKGFL